MDGDFNAIQLLHIYSNWDKNKLLVAKQDLYWQIYSGKQINGLDVNNWLIGYGGLLASIRMRQ